MKKREIEISVNLDLMKEISKRFLIQKGLSDCKTDKELGEKLSKDIIQASSCIILSNMLEVFMYSGVDGVAVREALVKKLEKGQMVYKEAAIKDRLKMSFHLFSSIVDTLEQFNHELKGKNIKALEKGE